MKTKPILILSSYILLLNIFSIGVMLFFDKMVLRMLFIGGFTKTEFLLYIPVALFALLAVFPFYMLLTWFENILTQAFTQRFKVLYGIIFLIVLIVAANLATDNSAIHNIVLVALVFSLKSVYWRIWEKISKKSKGKPEKK